MRSAIARSKRVLLAAGFPWSVITGRYSAYGNTQKVTTGIHVWRVGVSKTVSVNWRGEIFSTDFDSRTLRVALAVSALRDAGLPYDDRGWLECDGE